MQHPMSHAEHPAPPVARRFSPGLRAPGLRRPLLRLTAVALLGLASLSTRPAPADAGSVLLRAVGDVMCHNTQLRAGYDRATGGYNFNSWFEPIKDLIQGADISFCNLETTLSGPESGYSGYPQFNSPDALAQALKWTGFTVVTTANNHAMDRGAHGVVRTVQTLDRLGILHTGTFASEQDRNTPLILECDGIKFGVLAYTWGTNGIPVPNSYLVNRIDPDLIARDAAAARAAGADVVVADIHWGVEYERQPNDEQRREAQQAVAAGVDIIFGSHPHVLEPIEWVKAGQRTGIVFYSMGNFVSAQHGSHKDEGIIAQVQVVKNGDQITFQNVGFIPTFVTPSYKILPVQRYLRSGSPYAGQLESAWNSTVALLQNRAAGIVPIPIQ